MYNLSYKEYSMWEAFHQTRPFNTTEIQLATIAYLTSAAHGGSQELEQFFPSLVLEERLKELETEKSPSTGADLNDALRGMFT